MARPGLAWQALLWRSYAGTQLAYGPKRTNSRDTASGLTQPG